MNEFVFNLQRFANRRITVTASNSYVNTGNVTTAFTITAIAT